jgi:hypothetical protein
MMTQSARMKAPEVDLNHQAVAEITGVLRQLLADVTAG